MTTALATVVALVVLSAAGFVPVAATVGPRWFAVPLVPLAGSVVAALAASASLSFGGALIDWFVGLALGAAGVVFTVVVVRPDVGPWSRPARADVAGRRRQLLVGALGFVAVVGSCAWCLRGLRTPTVGFDARALWVMRPGWFLQSHGQLLIDMRIRGLVLTQSAYPPLVSASVAVAWRVTGVHTARLGVTTMSVLDICALAAAALAVAECGRTAAARTADAAGVGTGTGPDRTGAARPPWAPMLTGVVAAVLLVFVAAGVTEPFLTNGYADPIWSLAAVGAVAFGLQCRAGRSTLAAAALLILVAGLSKNEGFVTAVALVALVAARSIGIEGLRAGRRRWIVPLGVAAGELAVLAWWPVLMRAIGARGASSSFSTSQDIAARASATAHGMSPYLHVLVVALPLSVVGGLVLTGVRRRTGAGNDVWAWLALAVGLVAVGAALVTGSGAIGPWIRSTVHRITEYPTLEGWWIVAFWAVVAASGVRPGRSTATPPPPDDRPDQLDGSGDAAPDGRAPVGAPA